VNCEVNVLTAIVTEHSSLIYRQSYCMEFATLANTALAIGQCVLRNSPLTTYQAVSK